MAAGIGEVPVTFAQRTRPFSFASFKRMRSSTFVPAGKSTGYFSALAIFGNASTSPFGSKARGPPSNGPLRNQSVFPSARTFARKPWSQGCAMRAIVAVSAHSPARATFPSSSIAPKSEPSVSEGWAHALHVMVPSVVRAMAASMSSSPSGSPIDEPSPSRTCGLSRSPVKSRAPLALAWICATVVCVYCWGRVFAMLFDQRTSAVGESFARNVPPPKVTRSFAISTPVVAT